MFEKYLFVGTNEYKASIKIDVLDVLNDLNKEIDTEKESKKTAKDKKLDPHHPVSKMLLESKGKGLS